jgi:hypothetical protein
MYFIGARGLSLLRFRGKCIRTGWGPVLITGAFRRAIPNFLFVVFVCHNFVSFRGHHPDDLEKYLAKNVPVKGLNILRSIA